MELFRSSDITGIRMSDRYHVECYGVTVKKRHNFFFK